MSVNGGGGNLRLQWIRKKRRMFWNGKICISMTFAKYIDLGRACLLHNDLCTYHHFVFFGFLSKSYFLENSWSLICISKTKTILFRCLQKNVFLPYGGMGGVRQLQLLGFFYAFPYFEGSAILWVWGFALDIFSSSDFHNRKATF